MPTLLHLAIEIRIDCNLQESDYWPQPTILWMPCKSRGKWPLDQWNTVAHVVFALPLSVCSLVEDGLNKFCELCSRPPFTYPNSCTSYEVRVPSLACGPSVESPGFCYCVPSSVDRPQDIHPSPQNRKVNIISSNYLVYAGRFVWRLSHHLFLD